MRIFFSAGEPSGDQHAACLIRELARRDATVACEGFGGPHMEEAGCRIHFQLTDLAVMGVLKVIPMLAEFRRRVIQAEQHFDSNPPDAVVLVDFPGFNWWIAKAAKRRGIPVHFYMPPQLWAWAPWRIRRIRKWVDHVICNLPFEYDWYRKRNVNASWVGHPFFDEVAETRLEHSLVDDLRSTQQQKTVGLLPGSRQHEIERNFPVMLEAIRSVSEQVDSVRWVVGNYRTDHLAMCEKMFAEAQIDADVTFYAERTSEVIEAADCCLMVSGSISLELMARRTPGVVLYRIGRLARLGSYVVMTCRFITLVNLIAGKAVMPEYISSGNPRSDLKRISACLVDWLTSPVALAKSVAELDQLAKEFAITGATERTAELLLEQLSESKKTAA